MTPNSVRGNECLEQIEEYEKSMPPRAGPRKYEIVYRNLLILGYWHLAAIYGLYLCFTSAKWATIIFDYVLFVGADIGVTAGAHRLWSHKSYKVKLPLEIFLMLLHSLAHQNAVFDWARDHRMHHKYSDTDGDPHNASRGLFFSHVGWQLVKKHPEVKKRGKFIDMSDIYRNPVLRFQKKYALPLIGTVCFILPTLIPMYFWGESFNNAWNINLLRYVMNLNVIYLVNSINHKWGFRPYDKNIMPSQNFAVTLASLGEGYHNYHHTFPWDYRAAEFGNNTFNPTTKFIDFFAWIGWAYDLKTVPDDIIKTRSSRTGDGTTLWGSMDPNLTEVIM